MAQLRRLPVSLKRDHAMQATRVSIGRLKFVYILLTDKKLKYRKGKSRVAYIGTTRNGVTRIAQSIAARAHVILGLRGVRSFEARIVTCRPRRRVRTWRKLERALLIEFREAYGQVPKCNSHGKKMRSTDECRYFARRRLLDILEEIA
jgi:hypothetical protein